MTATVTQSGTAPAGAVGPLLFAKSVVTDIPAAGNTDILEVLTLGLRHIGVYFDVATNDLDAFIVSAKFHPDDTFHSLYSAITSTPAGLVIAASGTLASTAAAGSGWFLLDVRGIYAIKISVSGTVADTTDVNIYASGSR
jgi:hypothetical protein